MGFFSDLTCLLDDQCNFYLDLFLSYLKILKNLKIFVKGEIVSEQKNSLRLKTHPRDREIFIPPFSLLWTKVILYKSFSGLKSLFVQYTPARTYSIRVFESSNYHFWLKNWWIVVENSRQIFLHWTAAILKGLVEF